MCTAPNNFSAAVFFFFLPSGFLPLQRGELWRSQQRWLRFWNLIIALLAEPNPGRVFQGSWPISPSWSSVPTRPHEGSCSCQVLAFIPILLADILHRRLEVRFSVFYKSEYHEDPLQRTVEKEEVFFIPYSNNIFLSNSYNFLWFTNFLGFF